jgi:MIP family channel proteins
VLSLWRLWFSLTTNCGIGKKFQERRTKFPKILAAVVGFGAVPKSLAQTFVMRFAGTKSCSLTFTLIRISVFRLLNVDKRDSFDLVAMKKCVAEFIGTFALVFAGTGAIVIDEMSAGAITHVGVSLTFGLVVLAMIYAVGDISGAHLNPAVSLGFFAARRFPLHRVIPYVLSQCAGAFAASGLLRVLFSGSATLGTTLPAGSAMQSFVLELILTAILMFVILSVSTGAAEKGITAGIAVGAVIALEAMFAGPICGASMNPARSLAPAVVSQHVSSLWIYLVAPIIGALMAVLGCRCVREEGCCSSRFPAATSP